MADLGPQIDDSTQSFVVRTWQESPGNLRGTVRHVQSQTQHGFTRLSQAQDFIEQKVARSDQLPASTAKPVTASLKWTGVHRRRLILAGSVVVIVLAAGLTVIASGNQSNDKILGSAIGQALPLEVIAALLIGLVLGSVGSALWLRRNK
jgi:hypothetical protein